MSQPLYIDSGDEVTTVIEKLKASEGADISLVVPKGALLLQSIVNLKLIKRAAKEAGKELTIITTDKIGRNLAAQVGLANLAHVDQDDTEDVGGIKVNYYDAEAVEVPTETVVKPEPIIPVAVVEPEPPVADHSPIIVSEQEPEPQDNKLVPIAVTSVRPRRRFGFLLYLLIIALIGGAALAAWQFPRTSIHIKVAGSAWSKSYPATLTAGQPGAAFLETNVADTLTFRATGTRDIGDRAHGTATLSYVQDSSPVTIPAGTMLSANNLEFTTDQAVTVPGAKVVNAVPVAGSATVPISASASGSASNLSNTPATVNSPSKVYGQINQTSGGTTKQVAVVTQTDVANAKQALADQLHAKASEQIKTVTQNGISALRTPTTDPAQSESYAFTAGSSDPQAGTQADNGTFKGSATLRRLAYDPAITEAAARTQALKDAPSTSTLQVAGVTSSPPTSDFKSGIITITETVTGQVLPHVDTDLIANQAPGKSFTSINQLIQGIVPGASTFEEKSPRWWPLARFPLSRKRISVSVTGA